MAKLGHIILRNKMLEYNLTQEALAESLGISDRHVRNLCYVDTDVSVSLCYRLSILFETPMESLLVLSDGVEE